MSKWSKLYEKEIKEASSVEDFINEKLSTKGKIIKLIQKYSSESESKIMEFGSGTGVLACHISTLGFEVTALDRDKDMIKLCEKYIVDKFDKPNIKFICKDILELDEKNKYDVCYSIGILEHYSDDEIKKLINKQTKISKTIIFGIPTRYFDEDKKMYGNERYLPIRYWRKLIKSSGCEIIEESSYHYLSIPKRLITFKKYFKPNPVHVFVIKKI